MRTYDFDVPLTATQAGGSEERCDSCTQWGVQSAAIARNRRYALAFEHTRYRTSGRRRGRHEWPSRVLLLVERRFGGSRASCAMDLIRVDAAGPRNRRFRAVDEQQH